MYEQTGNLSPKERSLSALAGAASLMAATSRGPLLLRGMLALAGIGLIARAAAGHCAMKSALRGDASLREGVAEQWSRLSPPGPRRRPERAVSRHERESRAVDEAVDQSFPASDPPASHLPDEPPVNAEAKWQAAEAAGRTSG